MYANYQQPSQFFATPQLCILGLYADFDVSNTQARRDTNRYKSITVVGSAESAHSEESHQAPIHDSNTLDSNLDHNRAAHISPKTHATRMPNLSPSLVNVD